MSFWTGPIKDVPALSGPDSPGVAPFAALGAPNGGGAGLGLPNTSPSALPSRPVTNAVPSSFRATLIGAATLGAATTYNLQVPGSASAIPAGAYYPGDRVRFFFTAAQFGGTGHNVAIVDGGTGTPTLATILQASAVSFGWVEVQLNATGTHWVVVDGGYI